AGREGGQVVATGTPEMIVGVPPVGTATKRKTVKRATAKGKNGAARPMSHTAKALAPVLAEGPYVPRTFHDPYAMDETRQGDLELEDVGRDTKMPWEVDGRRWHAE